MPVTRLATWLVTVISLIASTAAFHTTSVQSVCAGSTGTFYGQQRGSLLPAKRRWPWSRKPSSDEINDGAPETDSSEGPRTPIAVNELGKVVPRGPMRMPKADLANDKHLEAVSLLRVQEFAVCFCVCAPCALIHIVQR